MFQQPPNNPMQFKQQFEAFARNFQQSGQNAQQIVQQLLNQGKMTQAQFNQLREQANRITGMRL